MVPWCQNGSMYFCSLLYRSYRSTYSLQDASLQQSLHENKRWPISREALYVNCFILYIYIYMCFYPCISPICRSICIHIYIYICIYILSSTEKLPGIFFQSFTCTFWVKIHPVIFHLFTSFSKVEET